MSGQDVVRRALEGNANIVEVEVEYRKGKKAKYDLFPGNSPSRQAQIERLLESVKWEKVEEVEMEHADGYKEELDLEAELDDPKKAVITEEAVVDPIAETASQAETPAEQSAVDEAQEKTSNETVTDVIASSPSVDVPMLPVAQSAPIEAGSRPRGRKSQRKPSARQRQRTGVAATNRGGRNKAVTKTRVKVHSFKSVVPLVTEKKAVRKGGRSRSFSRVTLFI